MEQGPKTIYVMLELWAIRNGTEWQRSPLRYPRQSKESYWALEKSLADGLLDVGNPETNGGVLPVQGTQDMYVILELCGIKDGVEWQRSTLRYPLQSEESYWAMEDLLAKALLKLGFKPEPDTSQDAGSPRRK